MGASTGLAKADKAALDMIDSLPDHTAKVAARGNLGKGVVAKAVADRLIRDGKVRVVTGGRITTDLNGGDKGTGEQVQLLAGKNPNPPEGETLAEAIERGTKEQKAHSAKVAADLNGKREAKTNGRKAKAERLPYSSSTPTNTVKRHGKSRRTGTETQIVDLLTANGPKTASEAMGKDITLVGSGRFDVECLTHKTHKAVPDMTEAKPLQARTDQFCKQCAKAVADKDKAAAS